MKRLNLILFVLCMSCTLWAQDRLSIFLGRANRYAEIELSDYRHHLCAEYNVPNRLLDRYYRACGQNWGNVGIALEIAHTTGRKMSDVCKYYDRYHRHGWSRILLEIGIGPDSRYHRDFYNRIHYHSSYWDNCYHSYCDRHPKYHKRASKYHKHHKHSKRHKCMKRYYDDDDDDYDDDDD